MQVESRIDQDPQISQQLSLWNQRGSQVIRGNLLVIPIQDSFVYVEPIYLLSDTSALPELKRVIVASDTRIAMRETLGEALAALLQLDPLEVEAIEEGETIETGGEPQPTPSAPLPSDATVQELIQSANEHFEAAETAQRDGNWARYGQEIEALSEDLRRLQELSNN